MTRKTTETSEILSFPLMTGLPKKTRFLDFFFFFENDFIFTFRFFLTTFLLFVQKLEQFCLCCLYLCPNLENCVKFHWILINLLQVLIYTDFFPISIQFNNTIVKFVLSSTIVESVRRSSVGILWNNSQLVLIHDIFFDNL